MKEKEILEHNKIVTEQILKISKEINELQSTKQKLVDSLKAPCEFCKYDGVYRCEACKESYYEGFNVENYPHDYFYEE